MKIRMRIVELKCQIRELDKAAHAHAKGALVAMMWRSRRGTGNVSKQRAKFNAELIRQIYETPRPDRARLL